MNNKIIASPILLLLSLAAIGQDQTQSIVEFSDRRETTHHIKSGVDGFQIGITSNAGGVLNEIIIPGIGTPQDPSNDIMDVETDSYGRCGQSSIRDEAHIGKFNPTQAGFNEHLGSPCKILGLNGTTLAIGTTVATKLTVSPFQLALWRADGDYDFTEFEGPVTDIPATGDRLYDDSYSFGNLLKLDFSTEDPLDKVIIPGDLGTKDTDNLVEGTSITHKDEIGSPFTYAGTYENYKGKSGSGNQIAIPVIRHYFEYRFDIAPNHSMEQFKSGFISKDAGSDPTPTAGNSYIPTNAGMPILDETKFLQISLPKNKVILNNSYTTTYQDMSHLRNPWSVRIDLAKWSPQYRHVLDNGKWITQDRTKIKVLNDKRPESNNELFIISEDPSSNGTTGKSLGFYRPKNEVNEFSIIGRNADGTQIPNYEYDRTEPLEPAYINESFTRTDKMSWVGFIHNITAMLNTKVLKNGRYETYRAEYFMLYGTPKQIRDAVVVLDAYLSTTKASTEALKIGERVLSLTTDLEDGSLSNLETINIFPNPTNDGVFNLSKASNWKVYSVLGDELKSGNSNQINLSEQPKGVYLIKMNDKVERVVVE